jgi:hypothetical protein
MWLFPNRLSPPRANRFRIGDTWVGPEGRPYLVKQGKMENFVSLQSLGWNVCLDRRSNDTRGFQRTKWGGQS